MEIAAPRVKVLVVPAEVIEDDEQEAAIVRLGLERIALYAQHAFGPNARYKGDADEAGVVLTGPVTIEVRIENETQPSLKDLLLAALDEVEQAVAAAARAGAKRLEEQAQQIEQAPRTGFVRNHVRQAVRGGEEF